MRSLPSQSVLIAAGAVFALGAAWAGVLYLTPAPQEKGPDPRVIRELASRAAAPVEPPTLGEVTLSAPPAPVVRVDARPRPQPAAPRAVQPQPPPKPPKAAAPAPKVEPVAPTPPPSPRAEGEARLKDVALMGVVFEGGREQAWLVNLANQEREEAPVGKSIFGFEVKAIAPESVVLTRQGEDFTLRLGEKPITLATAADNSPGDGGDFGNRGGRGGREGFGGRGGFGGFGGREGFGGRGGPEGAGGPSDWRERFRQRFQGGGGPGGAPAVSTTSNNNNGGGRSWGGGDRGGRSSGGVTTIGSSSPSPAPSTNNSGPRMDMGDMMRAASWGQQQSGMQQQQNNQQRRTTNPQTSRRTGSRLTGSNIDMEDPPDPIANPQTLRRLGDTTGQAFGQSRQQVQRSYNRGRGQQNSGYGNTGNFGGGSNFGGGNFGRR